MTANNTMKIEIEVSTENEGTANPWWMIIDPRQNFVTDENGVFAVAQMITGPFFSREEAQHHLNIKRHHYTKNAVVWCHSGYGSGQYREDAKTELRDERQQYKLDDSPCDLDEADDVQQEELDK